MSFSLEVKKELCKQKIEGTAVQSLLCGMILSSGSLVIGAGGITFTISSENIDYINFFKNILNNYYPSANYKETIEKLGSSLEIVKSVKEDVEEIKHKLDSNKPSSSKEKESK